MTVSRQTVKRTAHAPESRTRERGGAWLLVLFIRVAGVRICYLLAPLVLGFYFLTSREPRAAMADFYRRLGVSPAWRRYLYAFRNYRYFAYSLIDRMAFVSGRMDLEKGVVACGDIRSIPPGSILVGGHFGDWFCCGSRLSRQVGHRLAIVMDGRMGERYQRRLTSQGSLDFRIVDSSLDGLNFLLAVKQSLDHGDLLCVMGDRLRPAHSVTQVPFLGAPTCLPTSVYEMAIRLNRPVFSFFCTKVGNQPDSEYELRCQQLWDGSSPATAEDLARGFAGHLETHVCSYPHQWFNFFDFWSQKPLPSA